MGKPKSKISTGGGGRCSHLCWAGKILHLSHNLKCFPAGLCLPNENEAGLTCPFIQTIRSKCIFMCLWRIGNALPQNLHSMKKSLCLLAFTMTCLIGLLIPVAQSQSDYYCHIPEGIMPLNVATDMLFVQFKNDGGNEQLTTLASVDGLNDISNNDLTEWKGNSFVQLPDGAQSAQIDDWKTELRQSENVVFANPFFDFGNDRRLTYGNEIEVTLYGANQYGNLELMANEHSLNILSQHPLHPKRWRVAVTPESGYDALEMANLLKESGLFISAEVDFYFIHGLSGSTLLTPNDPEYASQWHHDNLGPGGGYFFNATTDADIDSDDAWNITTGSSFVKIAIIDDGVDTSNPDLTGNLLPGYDATGPGEVSSMTSELGHGTSVAEIAAASGNNNLGGAGVAYGCSIIPVKIFESVPAFGGPVIVSRATWVADGIEWAWLHGHADVLNNSWATLINSSIINSAINDAVINGRGGLGSVVLFSSGNEDTSVSYPATLSDVIAVGATSPCDERKNVNSCDVPPGVNVSWGSNFGNNLDVSAPGVHISGSTGGAFANDGTSYACPMVAGIVGLMFSKNPSLTGAEARQYLETSCEKVGPYTYSTNPAQPNGTWCGDLGYGRVNAKLALDATPLPGGSDVGVTAILNPESNCGLTNMTQVDVTILNYGNNNVTNVPVEYRFRIFPNAWSSWMSTGTLASVNSLSTANFSFNMDASAIGDYRLEVRTNLSGDGDSQNDIASYQFDHYVSISSLPYSENFENSNGGWYTSQANNLWRWVTVFSGSKDHIQSAGEGSKCWITNPLGPYEPFMDAYLYSPCFDFSSYTSDPMISFLLIHHFPEGSPGFSEDYGRLEYSTDGGMSWQDVGIMGGGTNWYNHADGWLDISPGGVNNWLQASHRLTGMAGKSDVRLRFLLHSDPGLQDGMDGMAIDQIEIFVPPTLDASVTDVLSPQTNCGMTNVEEVNIEIHNKGNNTLTSVPVEYRFAINGAALPGTWQSAGSYTGSILSGMTDQFLFTVDFSQVGDYVLEVRTQLSGDGNATNDTKSYSFNHYAPLSTFPASESFESGAALWTSDGTNSSWALGSPFATVITSASDGVNAWATNLYGNSNPTEASYVESPCYDFSALTNPQIKMDVWYEAEDGWDGANLSYSTDGGQTWTVVGAAGDPNNWYNSMFAIPSLNGGEDGWTGHNIAGSLGWLTATRGLSGLSGESNVKFRVNFGDALNNNTEGFAFDNVIISNANSADVGVQSINNPKPLNCSLSSNENVKVVIKNFGAVPVSNINVEYKFDLNGVGAGPWLLAGTFMGSIPSGQVDTFNFNLDLSQHGDYDLDIRTVHLSDQNPANDSLRKTVSHFPNSISFFPYCENFEFSQGDWLPTTSGGTWAYGTPAGTKINAAAGGTKAYATNLTGNYGNSETAILLSPCIDASGLNFAKINFDLWYETQSGSDGLKFQYSIDGGESWLTEYFQVNPYDNSNLSVFSGYDEASGWTGSSGQWVNAQAYFSPLGSSEVFLRFVFASDGSTVDEGVAIDNICIYSVDENIIAFSNGCSSYTVHGVKGNDQVHIVDQDGSMVAYLYPNGNDLGTVTVELNDMLNVPQAANSTYYIPRYFNLTCSGGADCPSSGNFPQGNVTVGFYLETFELDEYNFSGGTMYSFAQLNATHFDGPNENCTLNDNPSGSYTFISNASMFGQNYNNGAGYQMEFSVSKFSEFGFHGSNQALQPPPVLPLDLIDFQGFIKGGVNYLNWTTAQEENMDWHIIERSQDGEKWEELGRVKSENQLSETNYFLEDKFPFQVSYYRIKSVEFDGKEFYSKIISLKRQDGISSGIFIYPNPVKNDLVVSFSQNIEREVVVKLRNINGQLVQELFFENIEPGNLEIDFSLINSGVYFLEINNSEGTLFFEKIIK